MEVSKEYRLLKQNIDFDLLINTIDKIESANADLKISICETIPDDIINDYVEFGIEAEENTAGILRAGEKSNLSIERIKTQYNLRSADKFYFDVLIFNKENSKIVARLNSWGFLQGGPYFIFHLYVKKDFRKRGLGKLLLYKTIKIATDNIPNLTKFEIQTHESNEPAQKIIGEIGFALH